MTEAESFLTELNSRLADALAAIYRAGELARHLERAAAPQHREAWGLVGARLAVTKQHLAGAMDPVGREDMVSPARSFAHRRADRRGS